MSNIKYKHAESEGWFYKISLDENGVEISRTGAFKKGQGNGYYQEMIASGKEIEPQYTPEELVQKEIDDLQNSIDGQRSQCIQLLNDSEKCVSMDPPYPDDVPVWTAARAQWRTILKSENLETIPDKPF